MKKVIIIVCTTLIVLTGFLVFISTYAYDKNHFGESLEAYADPSSLATPITAEIGDRRYLIHPYNRYQVYKVATRGSGTRKKHYSETVTDGTMIKVFFGDSISFTLYEDTSAEDNVYFTYEEDGKKKYYSLEKLAMIKNMTDAVDESSGNYHITSILEGEEKNVQLEYAKSFWDNFLSKGAYNALYESGTEELKERINDIERKNDLIILTNKVRKLGSIVEIADFTCYQTDSFGASFVMTGSVTLTDGWAPFELLIDANGSILDYCI